MSTNTNSMIPALVAAQAAGVYTPPPPPQWRPGMSAVELEQFRNLRDLAINANLARIVEERRRTNYVPRGESLINPLGVEARVTSLPAESRFHPVLREDVAHTGLDFVPVNYDRANPPPVFAASSFTVLYVGRFSERAGNFIMGIDDDNRICCYAHLADGSIGRIQPGDHIAQGQQIARMGNTGPVDAAGNYRLAPHLHFGVRVIGEAGREQSLRAQAQRLAMRNVTVQPLGENFIADPMTNYSMYDVVTPTFEGQQYRVVGDRIPAPSAGYMLVARDLGAPAASDAARAAMEQGAAISAGEPISEAPTAPTGYAARRTATGTNTPPF